MSGSPDDHLDAAYEDLHGDPHGVGSPDYEDDPDWYDDDISDDDIVDALNYQAGQDWSGPEG